MTHWTSTPELLSQKDCGVLLIKDTFQPLSSAAEAVPGGAAGVYQVVAKAWDLSSILAAVVISNHKLQSVMLATVTLQVTT